MKDLLTDLLEYMESRADAEGMQNMGFQIRIEEALAKMEPKPTALQPKGKTDVSKLKDADREMEGNLSVLIGSEIAIINKGTKQEIDWQMISEWIIRKINPKQEPKGKTKEELKQQFANECTALDNSGRTVVKGAPMEVFEWFWANQQQEAEKEEKE